MPCLIKLSDWLKWRAKKLEVMIFYSFFIISVLVKTEVKRFFTIDKFLVTAQASSHPKPPVRLAILARDAAACVSIKNIMNCSHFVVDEDTNSLRRLILFKYGQTLVWHWYLHSAQISCSSWFVAFYPHCESMCLFLVSKGLPNTHIWTWLRFNLSL